LIQSLDRGQIYTGVSEGSFFLGVAMKSLLDAPNIWSSHTIDQAKVPAPNIRNSLSDRWIVLNFLQEFPEAIFLCVAMKLQ